MRYRRLIQAQTNISLAQLIATQGATGFRAAEEHAVLSLPTTPHVIATGGSVVYSPTAMAHLATLGTLVYLELPLPELLNRLGDYTQRGILMPPTQTLAELYAERVPLYQRYAHRTVSAHGSPAAICATLSSLVTA